MAEPTPFNIATQTVVDTKVGTGWTLDVTACNLDSNVQIKDFFITEGTTVVTNLENYTKTSATLLTYNGPAIASTAIQCRRQTQLTFVNQVNGGDNFTSPNWNYSFQTVLRVAEEARQYGIGPGSLTGGTVEVNNNAYGSAWSNDTVSAASRQAIYNEMETKAPTASPILTGTPQTTVPDSGDNTTRIPTTSWVRGNFAGFASPGFTGTPTAPTPPNTDNSTRLATTAFVQENVDPVEVSVAAAQADADTAQTTADAAGITATTALNNAATNASSILLKADIDSPSLTGTPTAPTASRTTANTQLATTAHVRNQAMIASVHATTELSVNLLNDTDTAVSPIYIANSSVMNSPNTDVIEAGQAGTYNITLKEPGFYRFDTVIALRLSASATNTFLFDVQYALDGTLYGPRFQHRVRTSGTINNPNGPVVALPGVSYIKTTAADEVLTVVINLNENGGASAIRRVSAFSLTAECKYVTAAS